MIKKIIIAVLLFVAGSVSWYAEGQLNLPQLDQITKSLFTFAALYTIFEIGIISVGIKQIQDAKSAYRYRKTVGILFYLILALAVFRIWIEDPQALLVSYGIVAAGATIALQDLIKNIAGGIVILANNLFRVGDRIQIQETMGDVIDVGLFNTTILEIQNWVKGDLTTGRIVSIPNGIFLSKQAVNYTRDHEFIWDEMMIPVTFQSDWKKASKLLKDIAKRRTKDDIVLADKQLKRLARKFYISERETMPQVFTKVTDNWVELHLRYITGARERRMQQTLIYNSILTVFGNHEDIQIASTTLDIIGFPKK